MNSSIPEEKDGLVFEVISLTGETWHFPFCSTRLLRAHVARHLNTISTVVQLIEGQNVIMDESPHENSADTEENKFHPCNGKIKLNCMNNGEAGEHNTNDLSRSVTDHLEIEDYRIIPWVCQHLPNHTADIILQNTWFTAAELGREVTIKYLLTFTEWKIYRQPEKGDSQQGNGYIRKGWKDQGIDINIQDAHGMTALMLSGVEGHHSIAERLIQEHANVNLQDHGGATALFWSAVRGHCSIVDLLIIGKSNVNHEKTFGYSGTPLTASAANGYHDVVDRLILGNVDVNYQNVRSVTALMWAVKYNYPRVIDRLIQGRANINLKDNNGKTALSMAHEKKLDDIIDYLEEERLRCQQEKEEAMIEN